MTTNEIDKDKFNEYLNHYTGTPKFGIYSKIIDRKYNEYLENGATHKLRKNWENIDRYIDLDSTNVAKAVADTKSLLIGSRGAQYLLELALGAIRLEKHLVKMPNHPTKEIRNCPFCQMDLKTEELIHVTILCPLAQYVWINIKVALERQSEGR